MKTGCMGVVLSVVLLSGCLPSLHELYTEETLVYDAAFVGRFQESENVWEFTGNASDKSYDLIIYEEDDLKSEFKAHLVNVQGQLFFDLFPTGELKDGEYTQMHLIPAHLFWKADKTGTGFTLAAMDPETVTDLLEENPGLIKHEVCEDDRIVLTDSPQNLQKFLQAGLSIEGFFGDKGEFERIREPESEAPAL